MSEFVTKTDGSITPLAGGMVRSDASGKIDYTLAFDGPLFERFAALLSRGAKIYGARNWMKAGVDTDPAAREATKQRYVQSFMRHAMSWLKGERDEDHAAACVFNLNGYEYMLQTDPKETP